MQIRPTSSAPGAASPARPQAETTPAGAEPQDRIILGSTPRILVGAPTGRLSPQIPPAQQFTTPVALEIEKGVGISLDGEALVVGHDGRPGTIRIIGHLEDGTFPQRDFTVQRDGRITVIDGFYDWQDYTLTHDGAATVIDGENPRLDSTVREDGSRIVVDNEFLAGRYQIDLKGNEAIVDCQWDGDDYRVTTEGNVTHIAGPIPERTFDVTRMPDGQIQVKGHYRFQDFTITPNDKGFTVQGLYPQQKFDVVFG